MECCSNEIQISFSPLELEVVRLAVEKFAHVEISETRSPNQLDHAQNVIRVLKKIIPVHAAPKCGPSIAEEVRKTEKNSRPVARTGKPVFNGSIFNCYVVSRNELEEIM